MLQMQPSLMVTIFWRESFQLLYELAELSILGYRPAKRKFLPSTSRRKQGQNTRRLGLSYIKTLASIMPRGSW